MQVALERDLQIVEFDGKHGGHINAHPLDTGEQTHRESLFGLIDESRVNILIFGQQVLSYFPFRIGSHVNPTPNFLKIL